VQNHKQNGNYDQCCIHTATIMAIATIVVVLLLLFNKMMNVIFMMDNFDANAISPQEVTMLFESMNAVAPIVVMNLTADKQKALFYFQWQ
jgi:hypothetical protein